MTRLSLSMLGLCSLLAASATSAQPPQDAAPKPVELRSPDTAPAKRACRNISRELRTGAAPTRDAVIAEMVRARAEGEMDFHITSTPPAVYRPLCDLVEAPAKAQDGAKVTGK